MRKQFNQMPKSADESVNRPETPEKISGKQEQGQDGKKEVLALKNVAELLDQWEDRYRQKETTEGEKMELSYKILKMKQALSLCKLEAKNVQIKEDSESGTVGLYDVNTKKPAITPEGLELPPEHFADVLVHEEMAHGGGKTGKRIFDEGLAEILTKKILPEALHGFYEEEQSQAKKTFARTGMNKALEKYDYDHPAKLAIYYLGAELKYLWENKLKREFDREKDTENFNEKKFLDKTIKHNTGEFGIEKLFKKGVPEMHEHLKKLGFNFKIAEARILEHMAKQE